MHLGFRHAAWPRPGSVVGQPHAERASCELLERDITARVPLEQFRDQRSAFGSISILRVVVLVRHGSGRVARRIGHSGGRHSRSPVWPLSGRVCLMKWSINDTAQRAARATCGRRRTRGLPSSAAVEGTREQYLGNVQADVAARIPAESARSSFTSRAAIENSRGSLGKARS
jgi:hypothetical protein